MSNPYQDEIEDILMNRSRRRYALVLKGMQRGLTCEEMSHEASAAGEPIQPDSIAYVQRILKFTLRNELVTAPSDAEEQANVFRELLNHQCSPGLLQHINAKLAELSAIGPNVRRTPLGEGILGTGSGARREDAVPTCPACYLQHRGECP